MEKVFILQETQFTLKGTLILMTWSAVCTSPESWLDSTVKVIRR